jgi:hypothetical protein
MEEHMSTRPKTATKPIPEMTGRFYARIIQRFTGAIWERAWFESYLAAYQWAQGRVENLGESAYYDIKDRGI